MAKKERAPFTPNEVIRMAKMAGYGMNNKQIASIMGMGITSFETRLREDAELHAAIEKGREDAINAVSKTAYQMAVSGKVPAMTMFYLKCRARWKEVSEIEHTGKVTLEELITKSYEKEKKDKEDGESK